MNIYTIKHCNIMYIKLISNILYVYDKGYTTGTYCVMGVITCCVVVHIQ